MKTRFPAILLVAMLFVALLASAAVAAAPHPPTAPADASSSMAWASPSTAGVEARPDEISIAGWSAAQEVDAGPARAAASSPTAALGERAMETVRALADGIGSRPAGSAAERTAASFLADEFAAMGYAVDLVPFSFSERSGSGRSQNVVAYDPNEDANAPLVVIGGHYDSVPAGPGANDNGSGSATTLEVARQLAAFPVPGVAVRYVAFGAEEIGLLGSKDYVSKLSRADRVRLRVAISIDMMAVGAEPAFGGSDPWLSEALARAASQGWEPQELSSYLRRMSDHASFLDAGIPALMFHWVDDPYYHTALDVSGNVQPYSMELMAAIAIDLVRVAAR